MSIHGYGLYNLVGWIWGASTQPDDTEKFSNAVVSNISGFENQLTTTFAKADKEFEKQIIDVDYMCKMNLKGLDVRYYFTNQHYDWTRNESQFSKIFLAKPISKEINYAELDEDTHIRIDEFIQKASALFPKTFAGIRFEDSKGSSNLTKVIFVAQTHFEYNSKANAKKPNAQEIATKIRSFDELTKLLEDQITRIIEKKPISLVVAVENPFRADSVVPKLIPEKFKKVTRNDSNMTELPFAGEVDTNLKAADLLDKQSAFNALFNSEPNAEYSFDMRDGTLQFDVTYQKNAAQFTGTYPALFNTRFNVTKDLQESQRRYCIENSSIVKPQGSLNLVQDNFNFNFQYMVHAHWPVNETPEKVQENLNSFWGSKSQIHTL